MAQHVDPEFLTQVPLFAGLEAGEHARLAALLHRRVFPAGTNIMMVGEPGEQVFILISGTLKIYVDQVDGSEVILAFLGPGDTVGEMSLIDSSGRSANVLTMEKTTCLAMGSGDFRNAVQGDPRLSLNIVRMLAGRLRVANEQILALSTLDVRGRVARQILAFAEQYGRRGDNSDVYIPLRLTQTDVASIVGASRESVNQVIVDFKQSGFISVDTTHHITLHSPDALIERCH